MKLKIFAAALLASTFAMPVAAAPIYAPVPVANYITVGGTDWAWASPCAFTGGCSSIDLSYQSTQGWRTPTRVEWAARPTVLDFAGKCASAWFDNSYSHCDFGDPDFPGVAMPGVQPTGVIWDFGYGTSNYQGYEGLAETWLVRGAAVPEPATWAMMIAGFGLVGFAARRRAAVAA
ncbi:PEPxxWA-CTERM sorting domain-containing protein [Sandaracinobacteroides saxicola]|uniref:PEPxxWA-CTERM sorting domain-containing protein n=1 Tax=Sandaracinobacteroides saxicola TaxID=2759707 RepID=A0A7G5IJX1_9SPHN|nr:PEPxxWA-CTERM sorting domain-containing protein [Sandaracinobacteroides saxicola]QMW23663.1 PEPxxWA-CTERM sorting domain-containing protein [Sandaracinobacteroides saxicola]